MVTDVMGEATVERVTFGAVLRVAEFRALWIAEAQSMAGDQLARVALSVLVFDRTGSPSLTALSLSATVPSFESAFGSINSRGGFSKLSVV